MRHKQMQLIMVTVADRCILMTGLISFKEVFKAFSYLKMEE